MLQESIWKTYSDNTDFPTFEGDLDVDVAIIGAGICGITSAQLLKESGKRVAVLELAKVGVSNTGNSTGNLYAPYGELLTTVQKKYGPEVVRSILHSRKEAIDFIEKNVNRFGIDCDFIRVPWFYYTTVKLQETQIEKSFSTAKDVGLDLEKVDLKQLPYNAIDGVRLENQAQFNPLRYVQGLAKAIHDEQCQIFENSNVEEILEEDGKYVLRTQRGKVRAKFLIHATHTPKGVMTYHTTLGPYREYGIACKVKNSRHAPGIYFGYFKPSHIHSTRLYERDGHQYLIVVGEPHKVGQSDSEPHLRELEKFAAEHFEVIEYTHRWGGQHYIPTDYIPYIGRKANGSNVFIASGFLTHGLVYGTVSATLISDLILERKNPYEEIYHPARFNPMKSAPKFIKENINVAYQYVRDFLKKDKSPFVEVSAGEGKVLSHDGHKLAVYRDEDENLQICSAICTHMACVVHWNGGEKSWDCPCHGSRFATTGEVLEGPAMQALPQIEISEDKIQLKGSLTKSLTEGHTSGMRS